MPSTFLQLFVTILLSISLEGEPATLINERRTDSLLPTECTTPENQNGYCLPIYNCLQLLYIKQYESVKFKCGPRNENLRNPRVCCEAKYIEYMGEKSEPQYCGFQNFTISRIMGGEDTDPDEFPWLVKLQRKNSNGIRFSCAGVVIQPNIVLTTAHCLLSSALDNLGEIYSINFGDSQNILIVKNISHPKYNRQSNNHDHDIALVFLKENVNVTPICLLEEHFNATEYIVSGWGKTETESISSNKMKLTISLYPLEQCKAKFRTIRVNVTENQICAGGEKDKDTCQGDSGGPLMVMKNHSQWFVAGLVSYGVDCGRQGWPGVYTNVVNYIDWIKRTISEKNVISN